MELEQLVRACCADLAAFKRKQGQLAKRQEDAVEQTRGQVASVSERVFGLERQVREGELERREAIDKANAVFQKHSAEVERNKQESERDRQTLMSTMAQVNKNFQCVSAERAQQKAEQGASTIAMQQKIVALEGLLQPQRAQIAEMSNTLQALRMSLMHTTPQTSFAEAEARHRQLAG